MERNVYGFLSVSTSDDVSVAGSLGGACARRVVNVLLETGFHDDLLVVLGGVGGDRWAADVLQMARRCILGLDRQSFGAGHGESALGAKGDLSLGFPDELSGGLDEIDEVGSQAFEPSFGGDCLIGDLAGRVTEADSPDFVIIQNFDLAAIELPGNQGLVLHGSRLLRTYSRPILYLAQDIK